MLKWKIKKINNKNSKFDFRLYQLKKSTFEGINFSKYNMLRILVSLASYLSNGVIFKDGYYRIVRKKNIPAIFDFYIEKTNKSIKYLSLDEQLNNVILFNDKEKLIINTLTTNNTTIFPSLFQFEEINNMNSFLGKNKKAYNHIFNIKNQRYLVTGWINNKNKNINLILDLLEIKNNKLKLSRYKIFDSKILNNLDKTLNMHKSKIKSFCLFIVKIDKLKGELFIDFIIPVSFDEYLSYIYDLMLPYKYDFNEKLNIKNKIDENNNQLEKIAFAIDPEGSKDRDDAISCLYLREKQNDFEIVLEKKLASHIKLIVHISDTLSYIQPSDSNYYYQYSKYKCNTDYLDKYNLPMMDRILSENYLSLEGKNKEAITINIIYKIIDHKKFLIDPIPEKVTLTKSKNLNIIGTTYYDFATSFRLKKEKEYDNSCFIDRLIINCNKKLKRDFNEFISEGKSKFSKYSNQLIANNLKQLYIFFVNSLNHTGKDTLIKLPSNFVRNTFNGKSNIYLDFSPVDMWAHSLIEYTALESNIYFAYLMYLDTKETNYNQIDLINQKIGKNNLDILFDNIIKKKSVPEKKIGIYRNLYSPEIGFDYYLNGKIRDMIKKLYKKVKSYPDLYEKFVTFFKYEKNVSSFLKLILALRQVILLINSKSNLEVSVKLISKEIKMKAIYSFYPFAHYDICTMFYTHATSPMRRFVDINVHNMIFNKSTRNYIFKNIDLNRVNSSINVGKYIRQLVNESRFTEFVRLNSISKPLITNVKVIDEKNNSIGFIDFINFFRFNNLFKLKEGNNIVSLLIDNYDIPKIDLVKNSKLFNIFFHMLNKEDPKYKEKCQLFLEKIFNVKSLNSIC